MLVLRKKPQSLGGNMLGWGFEKGHVLVSGVVMVAREGFISLTHKFSGSVAGKAIMEVVRWGFFGNVGDLTTFAIAAREAFFATGFFD